MMRLIFYRKMSKEWNIFSFSLYFYINMVQNNPIQNNVIKELGQK